MDNQDPSRVGIHKTFDRIARRYDLFNTISSFGQDKCWRQILADKLKEIKSKQILDLACGTGELSFAILEVCSDVQLAAAVDMSTEMLKVAIEKAANKSFASKIVFSQGDAGNLSFVDNSFDAVVCAFGVRNFVDVSAAFRQMFRVLRPGGRVFILEFSMPANWLLKWFYLVYLRFWIPLLGKIITGESGAYKYLGRTIEAFEYGERFCQLLSADGFVDVQTEPLMFGAVSLYSATKSANVYG